MNVYGEIGSHWWIGVVEDRRDPEKLGRCKVRIFGYHTENLTELPISDLPWAMPMTPITSGATSGVGTAPVGPLEGTWVVGIFIDGEDKQQPLMLGTLNSKPAKPQKTKIKEDIPENTVRDSEGNIVRDSEGNPIQTTENPAPSVQENPNISKEIKTDLPPLSIEEVQEYFNYIANDETTTGISKYKFSLKDLIAFNIIKTDSTIDNLNFTGKYDIKTLNDLTSNNSLLDKLMYEKTYKNYKQLLELNTITVNNEKAKVCAFLSSAHTFGALNTGKPNIINDNGESIEEVYANTNKNFGGDGEYPKEFADIPNADSFVASNPNNPTNDPSQSLNDPSLAQSTGYQDPNKVYPKKEYFDKPDTNKLACGDKENNLLKNKKKKRITNITTANSTKTWDEPESPYAAKYPYNQVIETEAGHTVEFDNTPGAERIHVYHKKGTYVEVDVNGTMVRKVAGDNYEIVEKNGYLYTKGSLNITSEGPAKIQVKNSADIQVFGETKLIGHKSVTVNAAEFINFNANNGINLGTAGPININSGKGINIRGTEIIFEAYEDNIVGTARTDIIWENGETFSVRSKNAIIDDLVDFSSGNSLDGKLTGLESRFVGTPKKESSSSSNTNEADESVDKCPPFASPKASTDENNFSVETQEDINNNPNSKQEQIDKGEMIDSSPSESGSTETEAPEGLENVTPESTECSCEEFSKYKSFPESIKLSKYYTLGALTTRTPAASYQLVDNAGLTKAQIACNLKTLAVNCLDKIKDKYPDMIITNAFRAKNSKSDHDTGCAADLQFKNHTFKQYYEIVKWIYENIPNTQILLEYQNKSYGLISWIHIAYDSRSGPRPLRYATFYNHGIYKQNQFVNLA